MRSLLTLVLCFVVHSAGAQDVARQLIVRYQPGAALPKVRDVTQRRWLSPSLRVELLTFASAEAREQHYWQLRARTQVQGVERNQRVDWRADPNDPSYDRQQSNFARAGFDAAWDLTPGGVTADERSIVVAVLDAGFDTDHEDLRSNLWRNPAEIPDDGLDNDGNGYVDDVLGWNHVDDNPIPTTNNHGTKVIGLLGARGDNGRGVTGTNWNVKMMLHSISTTADIAAAYGYVYDQRRWYNETGGARGAFVVATNASFGIEGGTCNEYGVWGSLYEDLGRVGVLTAASTANRHWDVDVFGDMPTDCPSDYLIGVTNVGETDALYNSAGFGAVSIDLAAPGEGSYTTLPYGTYGTFGSTSAAAPYVTGAIALLYATPCDGLLEQIDQDPAGAALLVREAIVSTTRPNLSLRQRTASGGILDVGAAQRFLGDRCGGGGGADLTITRITPNPATGRATLETNAIVMSDGGRVEIFDVVGRRVTAAPSQVVGTNPIRLALPLAGLAAGVYLVRLTERGRVAEARVVVR